MDHTSEAAVPPRLKAGFLTTEFWATVVTLLLPFLTLILHKDLTDQVEMIAAAAAAIASASYSISRAIAKSARVRTA